MFLCSKGKAGISLRLVTAIAKLARSFITRGNQNRVLFPPSQCFIGFMIMNLCEKKATLNEQPVDSSLIVTTLAFPFYSLYPHLSFHISRLIVKATLKNGKIDRIQLCRIPFCGKSVKNKSKFAVDRQPILTSSITRQILIPSQVYACTTRQFEVIREAGLCRQAC